MTRILGGLTGEKSKSEKVLRRFSPAGFTSAGAVGTFDKNTNRFTLERTPERAAALSAVTSGFDAQAAAFRGLRAGVAPGLSRLTTDAVDALQRGLRSRVAEIRGQGQRVVGGIRENLARRRLAGSSFQASEIATAEAEFTRAEDQARAEAAQTEAQTRAGAFLQEMQLSADFMAKEFESTLGGAMAVLQDLNMDTELVAQLTGQASSLLAGNIQAQAEARAAQQAVFEQWFASERAYAHDVGMSFLGGGLMGG